MPEMNLRDAVGRGLREALDADDRVFMIGEDIGEFKGPYAVTNGFLEQYGPERVIDSPISEAAMVGAGIGSALGGLRPIIEIMTINFMLLAMDQVVNHAAKLRYMSNGQIKVPMVIRTVTGGGGQLGATHSQSLEVWFATVPGLTVVAPSDPFDALGLLRSSIEDDDPVIFAEHALLYRVRGEVPDQPYKVPLGMAKVKRHGTDITLVAYSRMVHVALEAAEVLAERGVDAEVVDLRDAAADGQGDSRRFGQEDRQGRGGGGVLAHGRPGGGGREHHPGRGVRLPRRPGGTRGRRGGPGPVQRDAGSRDSAQRRARRQVHRGPVRTLGCVEHSSGPSHVILNGAQRSEESKMAAGSARFLDSSLRSE